MSETLKNLEDKRKCLYNEFSKIGDFRRGIISVNYRKCGKENCICAKEGNIGHGPQYLWNTTKKGKSYAKNLKLGTELQKCNEEIANYHKFSKIYDELVDVNEKICELRPIPEVKDETELDKLKKKLQRLFFQKQQKRLSG